MTTTLIMPMTPELSGRRQTLLDRLLERLALRQSARRLETLDDRILRDIGLTRYDLAMMQRGQPIR